MLDGLFILKSLKERMKKEVIKVKNNNKKLILLVVLIFVILISIAVTWNVMDSSFNSIDKESVKIDTIEGSLSDENIIGSGRVIINITS